MSSTSRMVRVIRCWWPSGSGTPGSVTSMRSAASACCSEAPARAASRSSTSRSSSTRTRLPSLPTTGRCSGGSVGIERRISVSRLLRPRKRTRTCSSASRRRRRPPRRPPPRRTARPARGALLQVVQLRVVHGHSFCGAGAAGAGLCPAPGRRAALRARRPGETARKLVQRDGAGDAGVQGLYPEPRRRGQRDRHELGDAGAAPRRSRPARSAPTQSSAGRDQARPGRAARRRARRGRRRARAQLARDALAACTSLVERQREHGAHARRAPPWARTGRPSPARR